MSVQKRGVSFIQKDTLFWRYGDIFFIVIEDY